jgi:hypothetical protein
MATVIVGVGAVFAPRPGTGGAQPSNGKRVLVRWPSRPFLSLPATRLSPGTYVWYVWPAVRHKGATPTFGSLIGRVTFVLE